MPPSMHARERMNKWFQPADGIAREVITADIQRYLGRDALVRPGTQNGVDGYWITAYRNLTSEMVTDLRQDSLRWRHEQQGHSSRGAPAYADSQTHQSRQYYGPSVTPAPPVESAYTVPATAQAQRDPYGQAPVRDTAGYATHGHASYATSSTYPQAAAPSYSSGQAVGYQEAPYQTSSGYSLQTQAPAYATTNYSTATQGAAYGSNAPGYGQPAQTAAYVTSTTPQSYDSSNQPRTVSGYEGYAAPGARTATDAYAAAYRTGQAQAPSGYGYTASAATARDQTYQTAGHTQPAASSSTAAAYIDHYTRVVQAAEESSTSTRKRGHESRDHRRR